MDNHIKRKGENIIIVSFQGEAKAGAKDEILRESAPPPTMRYQVLKFVLVTRGCHSNNSAVHMRDQRITKKGCFLRLNAICANRGQNVPIFEKKGPFGFC